MEAERKNLPGKPEHNAQCTACDEKILEWRLNDEQDKSFGG